MLPIKFQSFKHAFQFQRRRILKSVFFVPMFEFVTPKVGLVLTQGASYEQIGTGALEDAICQISQL